MKVLLTIGEFSRMTHLSVKALRHYHDVGLLEPADVDNSSGYRIYAATQVPTAQLIRRFRDLEMPLDDVRSALVAGRNVDWDGVATAGVRSRDDLLRLAETMGNKEGDARALASLSRRLNVIGDLNRSEENTP